MYRKMLAMAFALSVIASPGWGRAYAADFPPAAPSPFLLVTGIQGGSGSTIGPDGALYVPETHTGKIWRINSKTGEKSLFASGLPRLIPAVGIGGAMDIAFVDGTAYALVTLVGVDVGGSDVVGIYRMDGPDRFTVLADIGAFAAEHPPATPFDIQTGVQYALDAYRGGFLVTDGHHNRVLQVAPDGTIAEVREFGNIVPTGLEVVGNTVYLAEAGAIPHLPQDGKIVMFGPSEPAAVEVTAGASLAVDVELGQKQSLFVLSQGTFAAGNAPGTPAMSNTGCLMKRSGDGALRVVVGGLNQPTSFEIMGNTAYVVTLGGEIWKIVNASSPPYGRE